MKNSQTFTCSNMAILNSLEVSKQTDCRQKKTKLEALAAEASTLPVLQANLHASVALHTISSQVFLGTNKTICTSLVTKKYL